VTVSVRLVGLYLVFATWSCGPLHVLQQERRYQRPTPSACSATLSAARSLWLDPAFRLHDRCTIAGPGLVVAWLSRPTRAD